MTGDIEIYQLHMKKEKKAKNKQLPAFLLAKEERERLIYLKTHLTGKPKRN